MDPGSTLKLFLAEDHKIGSVSFVVFMRALKTLGGFFAHVYIFLCSFFNAIMGSLISYIVLIYSEQLNPFTKTNYVWLILFMIISFSVTGFLRGAFASASNILASRRIHATMTFHLLHCKVGEFLERIPLGRIINRFSEDVENLDNKIAMGFSGFYIQLSKIIVNFMIIVWTGDNVFLFVPLSLFFLVSIYLRSAYMSAKREVVRLQRISKSPVTSCIGEALNGMPELRAMKMENFAHNLLDKYANEFLKNNLMVYGLNGWFMFQIWLWTTLLALVPSYGYAMYKIFYNTGDTDIKKLIMFIVTSSDISGGMIGLLNSLCELEVNLISVERCLTYSQIEPENNYLNFETHKEQFLYPTKRQLRTIVDTNNR